MDASQAIATLKRAEPTLRAKGVRHAALFGSVARGDNSENSDLDILIEFDQAARLTIFDYV
ncbi:nucleotidyltransferase family protein, partial [Salmonella sp. SAL4431]|uniref:nucleotidyltransferase family protein n=1 Tax=Salmonella sp. SAL4431 TaxID=3159886 RepID=UPI0039785599